MTPRPTLPGTLLKTERYLRYKAVWPSRIWLAKVIGGEPVRHCMMGYERVLEIIDQEQAKDDQAVAQEWTT